jgi:Holliday junction resolvase RusA-like endonuclease
VDPGGDLCNLDCHPDCDVGMNQDALFEGQKLSIIIPGVPTSGNAKTRFAAIPRRDRATGEYLRNEAGEKIYRAAGFSTKASKEFEDRVRSIAQYECLRQRWPLTEYCKVDILIFNIRQDRGNVAKTVEDALEGIVYPNDGRTLDGRLAKFKDDKGPRVELMIVALDPRRYGY